MRRMPELDALRALAAAAVLLFHLDGVRFFAGWAGVDLFFVLSGYLITAIILREGASKGFLPRFYARRGLRIWPIYYLTILVIVAINPFVPEPQPLDELPYLLTFTKYVEFYRHNTMTIPDIAPLGHTWTLSMEEQFYLIWPAVVLLAGRRGLVPICLALAWISVSARSGGTLLFWSPYLDRILMSRCDGFALGGLLAVGLETSANRPSLLRPVRIGLSVTATLALADLVRGCRSEGASGFLRLPQLPDQGTATFALCVLFFGAVGLVATSSGHPALAPLRFAPLVHLGQISYGLYLYHFPIYWLIDGQVPPKDQTLAHAILKLGASLAAATLSWILIERPILRLKDRFRYAGRPASGDGKGPAEG